MAQPCDRFAFTTPAVLLGLALLTVFALPTSSADPPFDVRKLRGTGQQQAAQVREHFLQQLPREAYLPDGSVNTQHPEWQRINQQHSQAQANLRRELKQLDQRDGILGRAKETSGARLKETGSPPKTFEADVDLTPETYGDGRKLVNSLEKQGVRVVDQGPRWEAPELDAVVWKPYPQEPVGSSAKDAFVRQKAMPGSDAYANDGAMYEVSKGKYGVKDELGAAMANVKKGLDARADAAAGRGDPKINMKEELKSARKAAEYTGTQMDPELKTMAEKLKTYETLDEAGVYNFGDKPEVQARKTAEVRERIDQSWKESLETGARKSALRADIREQLAQQALQAGDKATYTSLREKAINARASNEVTMQAMAEDYPAAVEKLTGVDPKSAAGKEKLLGGKARVAGELMAGAGKPPPSEGVAPLLDRFKTLGSDTLRVAGEVLDTALPAGPRNFGGKVMTGMFGAGLVSAGITAEEEAAIKEGRRSTAHGAALEVLRGLTVTPYQHAKEITEAEIMKSDAAKESRLWAAGRALGEVGAEMSGHNMSRATLHEELLAEAERARELGREPHEWAAKVRAGLRVAGEMTLMNPIFEAFSRDFDAERKAAKTERDLADYARANLEDQLETVQSVHNEIQTLLETGNLDDPSVRARLNRQIERFTSARDHLERTHKGIGGQIGFDNPNVALINRTLQGWPNPADLENAIAEAIKPPEPSVEDDLDQLVADVEKWDREQVAAEGETAGAGSGWSRKGDLETLSANPEGAAPNFEPSLQPAPAASSEPQADHLTQSAEAAAARCDFQSVHGIAGEISRSNPGHPWLAGRYRQIQADEANYQAAQASLAQARGVLERPEPTNGDIQQAAQIALQAQSIAPPCMSQQVSMLNGPIYQAQAAVQERNRANRQAGMQSLLGALVSVQSAMNSSRTSTGYQPSYPSDSGLSTLTSAIGQAAGGGVAEGGAALAGGGAAPNCNACIISAMSTGGPFPYVFEFSYSFSNQGGCTSGRMRSYEMISFSPDEDANGNPLRHANTSASRYLQAKQGYGGAQARQVCGPCGSVSQAQATMRQLCPQPAHNISGGVGGFTLDGRRISPQ